jgi:hypothetical protein
VSNHIDGEIGFNQSVISTHHFLKLSPQFVILAPLQLSKKKKNYYAEEIMEGVFLGGKAAAAWR